jgi:hypothetical protein
MSNIDYKLFKNQNSIMTRVIMFLFLLFSIKSFSQDVLLECGDDEIDGINGNKSHFEMVVNCPYSEVDTTKLPLFVLNNAKKYLIERVGLPFYQKLNYYSAQTVDFSELKGLDNDRKAKLDKRVKYAIQYYFDIDDRLKYFISIVFDKNGKVISKNMLPNIKKNINFDKFMSACQAKKVAVMDPFLLGKSLRISLEYLDKNNSFVWNIEDPGITNESKREILTRFIIIDANNGNVIKRAFRKGIILCVRY